MKVSTDTPVHMTLTGAGPATGGLSPAFRFSLSDVGESVVCGRSVRGHIPLSHAVAKCSA